MKEGGAKEFRMIVGYELLMIMERNEDLPLPNINRLSSVMDEYCIRERMIEYVADEYSDRNFNISKFTWDSTAEYWQTHIADLSKYMRDTHKQFFGFKRDDGEFTGVWKFMNKGEWESSLVRNHNDIATRTDTYNEKVEDTSSRWKTDIERIADVPKITN